MLRVELESYINKLLSVDDFDDYCPNGLQIEGCEQIQKIICGVTASQALIEFAVAENADAILVHHGYFWKGEDSTIRHMKKNRIKTLLAHDISLFAYHLPLDAHSEFGNNVQLAKLLGLKVECALEKLGQHDLGLVCSLNQPQTIKDFVFSVSERLGKDAIVLGPENAQIKQVALCTGAAQSMFEDAMINHQIDAYLTGEVSEPSFHLANEYRCNFIAVGHHASERYGIKALGEHLAVKFNLDVKFIDLSNPI
jgi:dinuclear metal center YbgI/SA1388 family protein